MNHRDTEAQRKDDFINHGWTRMNTDRFPIDQQCLCVSVPLWFKFQM
jgi:hypothetical protein